MKRTGRLRPILMAHASRDAAKVLLAACFLAGFTGLTFFSVPAPTATAAEYTHDLEPGQRLYPGDILYSPSHAYRLVMQSDGNLVLYSGGIALWSSGTAGDAGANAVMQGDGNLVVYQSGKAIWSSGTADHAGALLDMQDDGNLVIYWSNTAIWSSGTNQPSAQPPTREPSAEEPAEAVPDAPAPAEYVHELEPGQRLYPGATLYSPSHAYRLVMQGDGNLVVYKGGTALWSSGTAGNVGANAVMQGDGNLVVYRSSGKAIWSSGTGHHPGAILDMQDDGNLVIYSNGTAIWSSKGAASSGITPVNRSILARAQSYPNGFGGGECIVWAARVLSEASGGRIRLSAYTSGYQGTYSANGARQVSSSSATGGDLIQVTPAGSADSQGAALDAGPLHTAIILKNLGGGNFYVIDSNWAGNGRVQRHDYDPYARRGRTVKIWRFR